MNDDQWIIGVRKCVTAEKPDITVEEIMKMFSADSLPMDSFWCSRKMGLTPQQAWQRWKDGLNQFAKR